MSNEAKKSRRKLTEEEAAFVRRVIDREAGDRLRLVLEEMQTAVYGKATTADVPFLNMPVHGRSNPKTGAPDWFADHGIPVSAYIPEPGDLVEHRGRLWLVSDVVAYLRLDAFSGDLPASFPAADLPQIREASSDCGCNCPTCANRSALVAFGIDDWSDIHGGS